MLKPVWAKGAESARQHSVPKQKVSGDHRLQWGLCVCPCSLLWAVSLMSLGLPTSGNSRCRHWLLGSLVGTGDFHMMEIKRKQFVLTLIKLGIASCGEKAGERFVALFTQNAFFFNVWIGNHFQQKAISIVSLESNKILSSLKLFQQMKPSNS